MKFRVDWIESLWPQDQERRNMRVRVGVTRERESQIDELGEVKKEEGEIRCLWTEVMLRNQPGAKLSPS